MHVSNVERTRPRSISELYVCVASVIFAAGASAWNIANEIRLVQRCVFATAWAAMALHGLG